MRPYSQLVENWWASPATLCHWSLTQSRTLSVWSTGNSFLFKISYLCTKKKLLSPKVLQPYFFIIHTCSKPCSLRFITWTNEYNCFRKQDCCFVIATRSCRTWFSRCYHYDAESRFIMYIKWENGNNSLPWSRSLINKRGLTKTDVTWIWKQMFCFPGRLWIEPLPFYDLFQNFSMHSYTIETQIVQNVCTNFTCIFGCFEQGQWFRINWPNYVSRSQNLHDILIEKVGLCLAKRYHESDVLNYHIIFV